MRIKIDYAYLISAIVSFGIAALTITGKLQTVIPFTNVSAEIFIFCLALTWGVFSSFCIVSKETK